MSDGDHHGNAGEHGGVRARFTGPTRTLHAKERDAEGNPIVRSQEPAAYVQYRDAETGQVHNLPASDIYEDDWQALPAGAREAVRDSGLYAVLTDAEAAERKKRARERARPAEPAGVKEG